MGVGALVFVIVIVLATVRRCSNTERNAVEVAAAKPGGLDTLACDTKNEPDGIAGQSLRAIADSTAGRLGRIRQRMAVFKNDYPLNKVKADIRRIDSSLTFTQRPVRTARTLLEARKTREPSEQQPGR